MPVTTSEPRNVPKGSRCTRCNAVILPEEFEAFLRNDHLCSGENNCSSETDAEYSQRTIATHKQPTTRGELAA